MNHKRFQRFVKFPDRLLETRVAMIRLFYSGKHLRPLDRIRILRVGAAVLKRVMD